MPRRVYRAAVGRVLEGRRDGRHPLLSEHHQAFFDSSAAKIDRLRREGATYIGGIDFFRKVFQHRSGITVNTIHGVKGAEFDVVIAFGLLQGS